VLISKEKMMGALFGVVGIVVVFFVLVLLSTFFGGVVGWVVGGVFPFVITTLNHLAGTSLTAFEVGAVLGFFGSFFRSSMNTE
jgi:hypothetical protein